MDSKLSVLPVSDSERVAGGFLPSRAGQILGGRSERTLRDWRAKGRLRKRGWLYTLPSVRDQLSRMVGRGELGPDYLGLFPELLAKVETGAAEGVAA